MDDIDAYAADIARVVDLLRSSRSVLAITGAGISADSGLPTYRGIGGLYNVNETEEGLPIEVLLSGDMLQRSPAVTWKYLSQVERACRGAQPNRAHLVLAAMEAQFERMWVLTQNVDGFHRQAGSRHLIDIHGDLHELLCPECAHHEQVADYSHLTFPPSCPRCSALLRPDVVLFGEMLPQDKVALLYEELETGFDLVFTIGTTSVFPYIAEPVRRARRGGIPTVEINPGRSEVSHGVDIRLPLRAAVALEQIWNRYRVSPSETAPLHH